jgi:hypothetical protein
MPKISQALRDKITDQQWQELFQDEKKLNEMLEYLNGKSLNKLEQRMFEVSYHFYLSLVSCYENPFSVSPNAWKKCSTNPTTGRKEGYFSANYKL